MRLVVLNGVNLRILADFLRHGSVCPCSSLLTLFITSANPTPHSPSADPVSVGLQSF